ncbi:hypothetical protein F2Q70_00031493 [Brassica cretica]|uniref:Transposase MuDR plant domain-containing protein n=1 Tax=Brassica cretica TaxID=69181 RepID=A0A8S9FBK3_BRACR|nr:hypothetical protein F2Q70_00031493 [Brassica cretica]
MAQEDYNLDITESVEITCSLPAEMMLAPDTPPIHVTSDRQVRNLLEITKMHRDEVDDMCFEDFEKIDGNSIYVNQSFVSKDALLSELRLTAVRFKFTFRIYKSTKTLLVTTCPVSGCQWKHITDAMKNMFGMTLDYTTSYIALLYAQTLMMRQFHAVYGEWLLKDSRWDFVVDNVKGARIIFLGECSTHAKLLAMAQENYNLDMSTKSVEITYSLPAEMMLAPDTPPIHVASDRQVQNLLEITKTHGVRLCVSSRSKVETVSEFMEEDDKAGERFEDDDDDLVEDENHDGEEDDGEEDDGEEDDGEEYDGEEDADISIVAEADDNGEDYSVYGNVEDEDEEDDDMCFEDFKKNERGNRMVLLQNIQVNENSPCDNMSVGDRLAQQETDSLSGRPTRSVGDRVAQRRHCTPKYVGRLFIDRVGIIDELNPQHIIDAMNNMFGMTLDYTTSYKELLYAQTLGSYSVRYGDAKHANH